MSLQDALVPYGEKTVDIGPNGFAAFVPISGEAAEVYRREAGAWAHVPAFIILRKCQYGWLAEHNYDDRAEAETAWAALEEEGGRASVLLHVSYSMGRDARGREHFERVAVVQDDDGRIEIVALGRRRVFPADILPVLLHIAQTAWGGREAPCSLSEYGRQLHAARVHPWRVERRQGEYNGGITYRLRYQVNAQLANCPIATRFRVTGNGNIEGALGPIWPGDLYVLAAAVAKDWGEYRGAIRAVDPPEPGGWHLPGYDPNEKAEKTTEAAD